MSTASQSSKNILMIFPYLWWYFRRYPIFPAIVLIVLVIAAIIGPTVAPYERDIGDVRLRHSPPGYGDVKFPARNIDLNEAYGADIPAGTVFQLEFELTTDNRIYDIDGDGSFNNNVSWNEESVSTPDILFNQITDDKEKVFFEIKANEAIVDGVNDIFTLDISTYIAKSRKGSKNN